MEYKITEGQGASFASITQKKSKVVIALISVDLQHQRTEMDQALEFVYPDALLSGAGEYTRAQFLHQVNLLGATIDISSGNGILTFSIKSTTETFNKTLKLLSLILLKPTFIKSEIDRIKAISLNELHEAREDSRSIAQRGLVNSLYATHDRRYVYGFGSTEDAVRRVTKKELEALHKIVFASNWTCSIAGNEAAVQSFNRTIKSLKKASNKTVTLQVFHKQKDSKKILVLNDVPGKQNIDFSIGGPVPITLHHSDYIPLVFGLAVLGKWGGFTGRLMSTVRELEGLTYGIYAKTESFMSSEQGYWRIMTFFAPEKSVQGLTSTLREIKKIHNEGITEAELEKFKTILHTGQVLLQDSVSGCLSDLHSYQQQGFSLQEMKAHKAKIATVSAEEVHAAIKKYLVPSTICISGAGPTKKVSKEIKEFFKTI